MATMLGQQNVPDMQIDTMLGHSIAGTEKKYIHFKPNYLAEAKHAIETYLSQFGVAEQHVKLTNVPPTCHSVPDDVAPISQAIEFKGKMVVDAVMSELVSAEIFP